MPRGVYARRRRAPALGRRRPKKMGYRIMRRVVNPSPTFTETYYAGLIQTNVGGQFNARISDIPQIADYTNLYNQYRINWMKIMVLPDFVGSDPNTYAQNFVGGVPAVANARIAYVINDTPNLPAPVNEADVLTDNGSRIKMLTNKFTVSFRPRPDKFTADAIGGAGVAVREKNRSWLSFADIAGNNPVHRGVNYWISALAAGGGAQAYQVYVKINFSLRDPK